jgi:hypothetical protein
MRSPLVWLAGLVALGLVVLLPSLGWAQSSVRVSNFQYTPQTVTIPPGGTVTWTLAGGHHTVTSNSGLFRSGTLRGSFSWTFPSAGTYGYHCNFHGSPGSGMYGTVIVGSGASSAARRPIRWARR